MGAEPAASENGRGRGPDRRDVVRNLENQLARTPRAQRPHEHAVLAYRLGLAYAESTPTGDPGEGLRKALSSYDVALSVFDPRHEPVEHARVLNAAGAAHRGLGGRRRAATLFEQAAELLADQDRDHERGAILNNLGLVRSELGRLDDAVAACDAALDLFDLDDAEGRRAWVATLHTRGMANAARGTEAGAEQALADYERARSRLDIDEAPYHYGLVNLSMGVACTALAGVRSAERDRLLAEAVDAFNESLRVFILSDFPVQHAMANHNVGLAYVGLGGGTNLRRALCSFEDAVSTLDTRVQRDAWQQAYSSLAKVEEELEGAQPGSTRADHFAALVADLVAGRDAEEGRHRLSGRLHRLLDLPEPRRRSTLVELALASARLDAEAARRYMEAELTVLIELPTPDLETGLRARFDGHRRLEATEDRERADVALDEAIGDALQGPQRISVRDFLYSLGYERP